MHNVDLRAHMYSPILCNPLHSVRFISMHHQSQFFVIPSTLLNQMAFLPLPPVIPTRISATCLARRSASGARRPGGQRARTSNARNPARSDPILDDGDIDTTDITTYVSCPTCFNSIMLRPKQLAHNPLRLTCNCCERNVVATMSMLENVDGSPFDERAWRMENWLKEKGKGEGSEVWGGEG